MIDVEDTLRETVNTLVPAVEPGDWDDVLSRAGTDWRRSRRLSLSVVLVATLGLVLWLTPLGTAIANGIADFSDWISGSPGKPVSAQEQQQFDKANATWLGFPQGTRLRRLATSTGADGQVVDLLGFRSAGQLCLRLNVEGVANGSQLSCTPVSDLRRLDDPVRIVFIDMGFGRGDKHAWYGLQQIHSTAIQITAGIVADGVAAVTLVDEHGTHRVPVQSNAFLYIATRPEITQRVREITATLDTGHLIPITFAPAPFSPSMPRPTAPTPFGPSQVERSVVGGTIGWLDRREERGEPLQVVQGTLKWTIRRNAVYGRVIAPDPSRTDRVAVTLNHSRHGTLPTGICVWWLNRDSAGGGCMPRATAFTHAPLNLSYGGQSSANQFITAWGIASDDVIRITAYTATGPSISVPYSDNAFLVDLPRAALPARLISFDKNNRVIGISDTIQDFTMPAVPARGKPRLERRITVNTGTVELYLGPAVGDGTCSYLRYDYTSHGKHVQGTGQGCQPRHTARPLEILSITPDVYFAAHVSSTVATIELHYTDGHIIRLKPRDEYVLEPLPTRDTTNDRQLVTVVALDTDGKPLQRQRLAGHDRP